MWRWIASHALPTIIYIWNLCFSIIIKACILVILTNCIKDPSYYVIKPRGKKIWKCRNCSRHMHIVNWRMSLSATFQSNRIISVVRDFAGFSAMRPQTSHFFHSECYVWNQFPSNEMFDWYSSTLASPLATALVRTVQTFRENFLMWVNYVIWNSEHELAHFEYSEMVSFAWYASAFHFVQDTISVGAVFI